MKNKVTDSFSKFASEATAGYQSYEQSDNGHLYRGVGKSIVHIPVDDMIALGRDSKDQELEAKKAKIVRKALYKYRLFGECVIIGDGENITVAREMDVMRNLTEWNTYDLVEWREHNIKGFPFSLHLIREDVLSEETPLFSKLGVGVLTDIKQSLALYLEMINTSVQIARTKSIDVLTSDGLDDALTTTVGRTMAQQRIEAIAQIRSVYGVMLLDSTTEFTTIEKNLTSLDNIIKECKIHLCSVCRIPMSRLFERSVGGLTQNGQMEQESYRDLIRQYQIIAEPIYKYLDEIWGDSGEFRQVKNTVDKDVELANTSIVNYLTSLMELDVIDDVQVKTLLEKKGVL